ncbi:glycosyltransferase [Paraburkholderia sp. HP33-1]|uniref:glycosyltransferase n=1 Tax=Paraburkholderia sp. HP33-1 TaxID=2883243 RepID=UPI001F1AF38B|nr:glycosyltransferase [Paraburkholderia sp. HP33-1]
MTQSRPVDSDTFDFSVVVPCHNESGYIENLLHDLSVQTIGTESFEVVVVDNNSSDNTNEVVWDFACHARKVNVRLVHEYEPGVSYARNSGARAAKGTTLIFLDADNRVSPSFLSDVSYTMHAKNSVAGTIRTMPDVARASALWVFWILELIKVFLGRPFGKSYVQRRLYEDSQGYNERIVLGENLDFLIRVKALAKKEGRVFGHIRRPIYCSLRRFNSQGYVRVLMPWFAAYCGLFNLKYQTMTSIKGQNTG